VLRLADEIVRVLRPGGRWVLHTVNGESPFFGRVRYGDFTHETVFTQKSLGQVTRSAGFSALACFEDKPTVHGWKSAGRALVWQAARAVMQTVLAAETGSVRGMILSQNFVAVATK
jgi:hypothetical protein